MPTLIAGRYEVLEELERRPAGTAYKVRHPLLDAVLAVTVLSEELTADAGRLTRLQQAVRGMLRLRHDHIVPVLDFGRDDGRYYVVEALASGARLDLRGSTLFPPAEALHIVRQLAEALTHAHARGVAHGAITTACVFVEPGTPPRAALAGFLRDATARANDAAEASCAVDVRHDVAALGRLLYEMLEGRPFSSAGARPDYESSALLPTFSRILPSGVSALVARAIRRTHESMAQLRDEIDACLRRLGERNAAETGRRATVVAQILPSAPAPGRASPRTGTHARPVQRPVVRVPFPEDDDDRGEPTAAQSAVARRLLGPRGVRVGVPRLPVKGSALAVAAVVLAGGWLALRAARPAPAASAPTAALARDDAPTRTPAAPVRGEAVAVAADQPPVAGVGEMPLPSSGESLVMGPPPPARTPPRIVTARPSAGAVDVLEGASVDFDVGATNGGGDGMTYAWFLDDRPVGRRQRWRFSAPYGTAGSAHAVEVRVVDGANATGPRVAWTVAVLPRMSNANVLDWVDRLAAALERKDVATLRLYGLVTDDAAGEALVERVSRQKTARVSVENESVALDGRYARVTFDLAEFDEDGTPLATRGEAYDLEKHPSGFVALRSR